MSGVIGFTIDEVARRSGVAKTTIYRHWLSRQALVLEAAARISAEQDVPPATTDRSFVVSALMGPLYYRRWFAREPTDERFVAALVGGVLNGLGRFGADGGGKAPT